ncbi:NUDIX domain-containing protein [Desulfosporosinus sp. SB140]|uniref:NUDIX domain-containing protein n=1 Tax=Desulfosporosinus paludis TaxID=3115649 RepID=UPI00388E961E
MNDKLKLSETRIRGEVLFEGRMLRLERDIVRLPNGAEASREVIRHPGAVAIIALQDQEVLLVRQYRYAIGRETLEIPAGKIDPQESPLSCAVRELREETGYSGVMELIGTFYTTPGFTDEVMHIFLARDLVWDPLETDDDEFLAVEKIPWNEALRRAQQNEFIDAKTILGILLVQGKI